MTRRSRWIYIRAVVAGMDLEKDWVPQCENLVEDREERI